MPRLPSLRETSIPPPSAIARKNPALAGAFTAAATIVHAVLQGHTPETTLARIDVAMRPAALDLAFTALRDCGRGDFLLDRLIEKRPKDRMIRALLLVALARLERRPDEAHTIVDQAVAAAAKMAGGHFKGLVNGVLRNFLRRRDELLALAAADPAAHWRHPDWWLAILRDAYPDQWQDIAAAGNTHPPMCLRVNRRHPHTGHAASADFSSPPRSQPQFAADYCTELAAQGIAARPLDDCAVLLDRPVPVDRLPGFAAGRVSVQDWGAQRAAGLLDVADGMRVLDACAAPGGKAAHLLECADLDLTALELDGPRAERIAASLARLGLTATLKVADASKRAHWWDGRPFDRILADVPCSASGVARRHPDIKWLRRPDDVAGFTRTQAAILDALWPTLAPGGKMLYCTCSTFPRENDEQVTAFVARHPDARRLPAGDEGMGLQLLPSAEHDGFYYALLAREN